MNIKEVYTLSINLRELYIMLKYSLLGDQILDVHAGGHWYYLNDNEIRVYINSIPIPGLSYGLFKWVKE